MDLLVPHFCFAQLGELAEQRLARLVSVSPAVLYLIRFAEGGWDLAWISPSLARYFGYEPHELTGPASWKDVLHPDDVDEIWSTWTTPSQSPQRLEYRIRSRDGSYRWILDERSPGEAAGSSGFEAVGAWLDITEAKEAEESRKMLESRLAHGQKMEALGTLAGGVAHDFNNLLGVIMSYADFVREALPPGSSAVEDANEIMRAANRSASLTTQLLAFCRKQHIEPRDIDAARVVADLEKMLRRLIGEDIELETRLGLDLPSVYIDPRQLEQAVLNLAINARDAMPKGGKLTIDVDSRRAEPDLVGYFGVIPEGEYVSIKVQDSGHGMDDDVRSKLFEPFFTTKGPGQGTGLGLATVYGVIKQADGHLLLKTAVRDGTTIEMLLPVSQARMTDDAASLDLSADLGGKETVLVVEDEEPVRDILNRILSRRGYRVLAASNAEDALRALRAEEVHLLVSDVVMPSMGGVELAERARDLVPRLPVLLVTGHAEAMVHRYGLSNSYALLRKPFTRRASSSGCALRSTSPGCVG
ncbi:MAG: response regulator [Myxococcales bacterium]|nr:response regulator [Myxococcales bacterium]